MKSRRYLILSGSFIISIGLISCIQKPKLFLISPQHNFKTSYKLGEPLVRSVGEPMIRIENIFSMPMFTPKIEYSTPKIVLIRETYKGIKLSPNQQWIALATSSIYGGYILVSLEAYLSYKISKQSFVGIHINEDGTIGKGWILSNGEYSGPKKWTKDQLFEKDIDGLPEKGSFVAELIYTGILSNSIKVSYREYVDDMARPAYYQDLSYELDDTKYISFRSIKIKVISANSSQIAFYIEQDDNLPWIPKK